MTVAMAVAGGAAPVPGFLAKLWALVDDPESDDVISWSQNGQNFSIFNEQMFAKELLPKYFKHSNLSSFIRQLNIYGFRKVMALENGMMTSDKNSTIEFQHPFFKRGKANLLANIKRKVPAARPEDLKIYPEDLNRVLAEVQEMKEQQNNVDIKLANMRRENEALWKEVSSLRQKHSQQQQLLSKIFEFILSLMRGNCIVGLKRKRSLTDAPNMPHSKYRRQYVRVPVEDCEAAVLSQHDQDCEDSLVICDITNAHEDDKSTDKLPALVQSNPETREAQMPTEEDCLVSEAPQDSELKLSEGDNRVQLVDNPVSARAVESNALELCSVQAGATEDTAAVIDSMLDNDQPVAPSDVLLDREEMQDFLNCIDASLEELQAMLSGKKINNASEMLTDVINPELPGLDASLTEVPPSLENIEALPENIVLHEQETPVKNDMQVIQYKGNSVLSLFEDLPLNEEACKLEDSKNAFLTLLEDKPSSCSPPLSSESPQELLDPAIQADGPPTLDQPLLTEDLNGEYKLFPLLLLSPVANFIEEASEIETS